MSFSRAFGLLVWRGRGALLVALVLVFAGALAPGASASRSAMERASSGPLGGNGASFPASIAGGGLWSPSLSGVSEDGSILYFTTYEQMTGEDTDNARDVYERNDGVTTIVSDDGSPGTDAEVDASYSGASKDGSSVYFAAEIGGSLAQYVRDDGELRTAPGNFGGFTADGEKLAVSNPTVRLITLSTGSSAPVGPGSFSGMSDDGSHVFFTTTFALVGEDTDSAVDVYERNTVTSIRVLVSDGDTPASGNGPYDVTFEGQSADSAHVFFTTDESLAASDTDATRDIYDRSGGATTHVSRARRTETGPSGRASGARRRTETWCSSPRRRAWSPPTSMPTPTFTSATCPRRRQPRSRMGMAPRRQACG